MKVGIYFLAFGLLILGAGVATRVYGSMQSVPLGIVIGGMGLVLGGALAIIGTLKVLVARRH